MNTTIRHETDVLIVGAGPTGLTLACELLRRGVRCRIIDKASAPATTSRALGLQPRTLELFDTMGIVDRVLSTGGPVIDANLYDGDRLLLTLSTAGVQALDTPYPRLWITPQTSVERPLEARLGELGGAVERACEFVGLREEDSRVIATVKRGDGPVDETEQVRAGWLVGCDGAHSRVRRTLDVTFEGSTYEEKFLLADVDLDWSRERNRTHTWFPPDGMFTVFPLPGSSQWRIFAVVEGETVPPVSLELFQRLFRERTGDATTTVSNPTWMSNFTINRRMVDRYQVGRIFLAGDAAHIHSPFGAQGMNTGIQDAYNLGWKLALVVSGKASEYLLDTYEEERLPVAKRVLAQTDANTRVLLSDNPVVRFLREYVLTLDAVQDYLARRSSQLFVNYRASSLSRSYQEPMMKALLGRRGGEKAGVADRFDFRAAPHAGDRAPNGMAVDVASREETSLFREFRGTHFSLLLFDGLEHTEAGYANLSKIARQVEALLGSAVKPYIVLSTDEVPEQLEWNGSVLLDGLGTLHELYGAGAESLYLIRPDGYVGLRGQPAAAEPLLEYLDCMEEGLGVSSSRDATRAIEPDHGNGKEVTAMKQKMTGERVAYVAPGRGGSVWIGDRELVTFKQTGAETGGLFALVEVVGLPGSGPPPHIHHRVDEVYCLLEGELEILDGDRTFTAEAGSVFRIPKGTLHAWKNRTDEPARTLLFICPAGFEGFFEEAGVQAADPSSPPPPPTQEDLRRMLELGRKYETEYPTLPNQ